jgi:hypothetical protein
VRLVGLGLLVGAVLQGRALAQIPTRDSSRVRQDSARTRVDSAAARRPARRDSVAKSASDTVKAPIARAEQPTLTDVGGAYHWDRTELFATGALNLAELLERVPGVTVYRTGWVATPHMAAYMGEFGRVRVFLDGIELDGLDARAGGLLDFSHVQIWSLEEVSIERGANEVRVYLRSWRVDRTTPNTRVDVATGDLETNLYRGFYGKRFNHGQVLQLGAQQFGTADQRVGGDGSQLAVFGRLGIATGNWTLDVVFNRMHREQSPQRRLGTRPFLSAEEVVNSDAYLRAGYGDPDRGTWVQFLAAVRDFNESTARDASGTTAPIDTVDTTAQHTQLVLTGGTHWSGFRVSAAARLRSYVVPQANYADQSFFSPSVRASFAQPWIALSAYGERIADDSTTRTDAAVRITPLPFLALGGAISRVSAAFGASRPAVLATRAELGVRVGRVWLSGGMMTRDTTISPPPIIFDTGFVADTATQRRGTFGALKGKIWKDVALDVTGIRWDKVRDGYLPQYQVRTQLYVNTPWLSRFPQGNFNILAGITHEYRTEAVFPVRGASADSVESTQYRLWSSILEIRLYDATLFWQFRNFVGQPYTSVPGFEAPRQMQFYGVRWQFFN